MLNDREKRKREVEDKLQSLNAKKHNLVQALKQVSHGQEILSVSLIALCCFFYLSSALLVYLT